VRGEKRILTAESPEHQRPPVGEGIVPAPQYFVSCRLRDDQIPRNQLPAQRILLFELAVKSGRSVPVLLVVLNHQLVKLHDGHSAEVFGCQAQVEHVRDGEIVDGRTSELTFMTDKRHEDRDATRCMSKVDCLHHSVRTVPRQEKMNGLPLHIDMNSLVNLSAPSANGLDEPFV
jgi:hypothetical protein